MPSATATALDETLSALADPTRRRVIELLREAPQRPRALSDTLGVSPPALSRHLRILRRQGLVDETHPPDDLRARVYQLRPEPFAALSDWLRHVEGLWAEQLGAFAAHVDGESMP